MPDIYANPERILTLRRRAYSQFRRMMIAAGLFEDYQSFPIAERKRIFAAFFLDFLVVLIPEE